MFLALRNEPTKLFARLVLEDRTLRSFARSCSGVDDGQDLGHARPALLVAGLIVPWPDIDA